MRIRTKHPKPCFCEEPFILEESPRFYIGRRYLESDTIEVFDKRDWELVPVQPEPNEIGYT